MTDEPETVYGACNKCRYVGEMKSRNGFLVHNRLGTDIECGYSGLELTGYGALSGDPVSEYLAKFAEEENAGQAKYHDLPHEAKAREILESCRPTQDDHPSLFHAIAAALREAEEIATAAEREHATSAVIAEAYWRKTHGGNDMRRYLQSPEGVHINMLSGKIAKISMMLCAHTHGEEAVREFRAKDARIAELTAAMKPFVGHGRALGVYSGTEGPFWINTDTGHRDIPAEDFRAAHRAMIKAEKE